MAEKGEKDRIFRIPEILVISFLLIIPLMTYCFNLYGKKILSTIENFNINNFEKKSLKNKFDSSIYRNKSIPKKEIITIWLILAIICFFILF